MPKIRMKVRTPIIIILLLICVALGFFLCNKECFKSGDGKRKARLRQEKVNKGFNGLCNTPKATHSHGNNTWRVYSPATQKRRQRGPPRRPNAPKDRPYSVKERIEWVRDNKSRINDLLYKSTRTSSDCPLLVYREKNLDHWKDPEFYLKKGGLATHWYSAPEWTDTGELYHRGDRRPRTYNRVPR